MRPSTELVRYGEEETPVRGGIRHENSPDMPRPSFDMDDDLPRMSIDQSLRHIDEIDQIPQVQRSQRDSRAVSLYLYFKTHLANILEHPRSSWLASIWAVMLFIVILLSVVFLIIESFPSQYDNRAWFIGEATIVAILTIEYILRLFATCNTLREIWNFIKVPVNIIDLLSFLPFYLEILFGVAFMALNIKLNIGIFQVMRLFRIFRLIRIPQAQILLLAISKSLGALAAISFYAFVTILIASTAIYYAERGKYDPNRRLYILPDGRPSQFQNIPICAWWAVVSMTTTGYGDMIPTTVFGKLIGGFSILVGVLVIALPSMIIGRKFGELSSQYKVKQKLDRKRAERERMYRELNDQQLREAQETDLIKTLRKHNRYLNEQKQQMQTLMKQAEETQRIIHQVLEQIEKKSNNGTYQSD